MVHITTRPTLDIVITHKAVHSLQHIILTYHDNLLLATMIVHSTASPLDLHVALPQDSGTLHHLQPGA